jgi:hypothetical protein
MSFQPLLRRCVLGVLILLTVTPSLTLSGQTPGVLFVGLGDSISESVQSADANELSQPFSFQNLIAWRMSAPFPQPLIRTNPFAAIYSTTGRPRVDPTAKTFNLGVSGADAHSLLFDAADAADVSQINSETDLVLFPWRGSQMQIAEALRPSYVACWIGNNDALSAALAFDRLDASQLTSLPEFAADFTQIADRLQAIGSKVVFATVPDISRIGYVFDRNDLQRFLGSDFGLPAGYRTSIVAALLVKAGVADSSIFAQPNFVLDPAEIQIISEHVRNLNFIIKSVALSRGMAVVDVHAVFESYVAQPPTIGGVTLSTRFLGGLFSLDGVHPSNIAQALIANLFLEAFNRQYGTSFPAIDSFSLFWILVTDPFVDKDGDGRVTGRFGAGLLETFAPALGFSGDLNDFAADAQVPGASATAFVESYQRHTRRDLRTMSRRNQIKAIGDLFDATASNHRRYER